MGAPAREGARGPRGGHVARGARHAGREDVQRASGMRFDKALKAIKMDEGEWPGPLPSGKVGGHPAWVQDPKFPQCPVCKRR